MPRATTLFAPISDPLAPDPVPALDEDLTMLPPDRSPGQAPGRGQGQAPRATAIPADHPAADLLDSVTNAPARLKAQEQEEWRVSMGYLVAMAETTAAALRRVIADETAYMTPLARVKWHDPLQGRRHHLYANVDLQVTAWTSAHRLLTQLDGVGKVIMEASLQPPTSRATAVDTTVRMVMNARGADATLRATCDLARHLIRQIEALKGTSHAR